MTKRLAKTAFVAGVMMSSALPVAHACQWPSAENDNARKAFAARRFGIFIHWGLYSLFGQGEWYLRDGNLIPGLP